MGRSFSKRIGLVYVVLVLTIAMLPCVLASDKVFMVTYSLDAEILSITDLYLKVGTPSPDVGEVPGAYRYEVHSFNDEVLSKGHFIVHNQLVMLPSLDSASEEHKEEYGISEEDIENAQKLDAMYDPDFEIPSQSQSGASDTTHSHAGVEHSHAPLGDGHVHEDEMHEVITVDHARTLVAIPYFENARQILTFDATGNEVARVSTVHYADTCGNLQCEEHESFEDCSLDCQTGGDDGFCDGVDDNRCDPDCRVEQDDDCSIEKSDAQVSYERAFVCKVDAYCAPGEDEYNCPADCGTKERWMRRGMIALVALLFMLTMYLRSADKGGRRHQ